MTTNDDGEGSLHVYDLTRGSLSRITPPTTAGGKYEIQILNLEGTPSPRRLVADPDGSDDGQVSPDDRWPAYTVRVGSSGAGQVFLRPFPNVTESRVQVSIDGGSRPVWAANSRAIFYSGPRGEAPGIWRVDLAANGQLGKPVLGARRKRTNCAWCCTGSKC